jgi:ribonuclease P protein component
MQKTEGYPIKRFSLSYQEKLHLQKDFNNVFQKGIKLENKFIKIFIYKRNNANLRRLGLVVSRKIGNAVQRNLAKRRIREIFRTNKHSLEVGSDLIFVLKKTTTKTQYKDLEIAVLDLLSKTKRNKQ